MATISNKKGWLKRENSKRSNQELECPTAGCRRPCAETGGCAEPAASWGAVKRPLLHGRDIPLYAHRARLHLNDAWRYEHLGMYTAQSFIARSVLYGI